jgi:hypothetical protein
MSTRKVVLGSLFALTLVALSPGAHAVDHGSFGIGVNSSLSIVNLGASNSDAGSGVISFRWWLSRRFALDSQFGLALAQNVDNNGNIQTNLGFLFGERVLFSLVNADKLRFNIGGEFLMRIFKGGDADAVFTLLFGFVSGVEYLLTRNLSVDLYFGAPFAITVTPKALFNMGIAGNVMAGFHYYF